MFLLTVGGVCWPHTLLFAAKVDASRYVRWYHWMGTDSNICVDTDIRVNETLRNGVRCTGMLACESFFFLLLEGEITITRCTLVARMMKRGPPLGIAPVSMMHSLEMMIDSLPFSTVSPPVTCLSADSDHLPFFLSSWVDRNGQHFPSEHRGTASLKLEGACLQVDSLFHGGKVPVYRSCVSLVVIYKDFTQWLYQYSHTLNLLRHMSRLRSGLELLFLLTVWSLLPVCVCVRHWFQPLVL